MAKSKQKTHKKNENEKGYIRELEKRVVSLEKQIRQYEKYERNQDYERIRDSEDTYIEENDNLMKTDCNDCGKGQMIETLKLPNGNIYGCCNICENRGLMNGKK